MIPDSKDAVMQQHLLDCKESGLSQKAYCQQHNIPAHIFYYYKNKLNAETSKTIHPGNQLIPVNLIEQSDADTHSSLVKISHSNGFSLELNPTTELNHLKSILELVRSVA